MRKKQGLSRRTLFQQSIANVTIAAAAGSQAASAQSPAQKSLNFQDPEDNLFGLMKLMADLSGEPRFWIQPGRIYAFQDGELAYPILNYTGCTIRAVRQINAGEYESRYRGWMLMQDPETNEVVDKWASPLTGETVDVDHFVTFIGRQTFNSNGLTRPENYSGDFTWFDKPFILPWQVLDDDVWCPYEQFSVYTDQKGNSRYEKAIHTYEGKLTDLENNAVTMAPAKIASQSQSPWFPWMNMDQVNGHMILRSLGKKYETASDLPSWLIAELEARYPGGLFDPLDWS